MTIGIQKDNLAKVRKVIEAAQAKIDALDEGLRTDVREARVASIRAEASRQIASVMADAEKRGKAALGAVDFWSQPAVRRRAKFSEDPATDGLLRTAFYETVRRVSTGELLHYLSDAVREKNLAKAEAIRLEFSNRSDHAQFVHEFDSGFAAVIDHKAKAMQSELEQIAGVADLARVVVREFETGLSRPIDRITAARAAGMAGTPSSVEPDADAA